MRLSISPMPGSLADVRTQLGAAQDVAGQAADGNPVTADFLLGGVAAARRAASILMTTQPESDYQDLVLARQQVLEGADQLRQAATALSGAHGVDPASYVRERAHDAFNRFEDAFEIIDNN